VSIYKLDPAKFPRVRRNIILTYVLFALVGLGVVYLYLRQALFGQAWTLIPLVLLVFAVTGWYALTQRQKYWAEFELIIRDNTLIRRAHKAPELRIDRTNISGLREVRHGLILSTPDRKNLLLVPRDLRDGDYEAVKRTLGKWVGKGKAS
jgi:hypothetical protein